MVDQGVCLLTTEPEDFIFEVELEDMCEEDPSTWQELANQRWEESTWPAEETRDSTSGELLDPKKVDEGCQEELGFMSQMGVWDKVTREYAKSDPDGQIVGTRWVLVKKGDKVRCRLVAQEFAGKGQARRLVRRHSPTICHQIPSIRQCVESIERVWGYVSPERLPHSQEEFQKAYGG